MTTRYVVIGAGAIGTVAAAALPPAQTLVVARGARLDALRADGLVLETPRGPVARAVEVVDRIPAIERGDVVLVAVKTQDVAAVMRELAIAAPPDTPVALLTNGLEAERVALRWFANVYGVVVMCPATHVDPRAILAWGSPVAGIFDVGAWLADPAAPIDPIATALAGALADGGLVWARAVPDIQRWKRAKLLLNLGNAVDALAGRGGHDSELAHALRAEGRAVFAAAGLAVASPDDERARRADFAGGDIAGHTRVGGSTYQSLARGAALTECEYLNGEIVALGRTHGVATPNNIAVLRAITRAAALGVAPGSLAASQIVLADRA